ncbi:rCG59788 [Rattus norvegicus]|uniref:RCG59788 n=1 Tax=Rattus norvegicus TaxID=10116 RepID=A6HSN3_RAT|nr:rCG59788 [Rattus norvegicus]
MSHTQYHEPPGVGVCIPVKGGWGAGRFVGSHTPPSCAWTLCSSEAVPHILKVHPGLTPPGGLVSCPVHLLSLGSEAKCRFFFFQPGVPKLLPFSGTSSALSLGSC